MNLPRVFPAMLSLGLCLPVCLRAQAPQLPARSTLLYGAAYYEEYTPTDQLEDDVRRMKATGMTVVRIAESTWGTLEPQGGVFEFRHVDHVLQAMDAAEIKVIVVPALYAASDAEITRLDDFAKGGGHVLYTFKSGFSDEKVKVRSTAQPGLIAEAAGVTNEQFTLPEKVSLASDPYAVARRTARRAGGWRC